MSLDEFTEYVKSHEKKLKLVFKDIDRNQDGKLDAVELAHAFRDLGVNLTDEEARNMIRRLVYCKYVQCRICFCLDFTANNTLMRLGSAHKLLNSP